MKKELHALLVEPTPYWKQRSFLTTLKTAKHPVHPDLTEIKLHLRQQRLHGIETLPSLLEKARESLSMIEGVKVRWAENTQQAAALVHEIAGDAKCLNINKSGTINEIREELQKKGLELKSTYIDGDYLLLQNKFDYFWQLPNPNYQPEENWFAVRQKVRLNDKEVIPIDNDLPSLVGVNALSAMDGTMFFLQHSSNIGKLLRANRVIILVGLEKVVPTKKEAEFQTRWTGNFGLTNMLLDLNLPKVSSGQDIVTNRIGPFSDHLTIERQIDVIFFDNGRLKILGTPFKELLLCLSCRSCLKRCPNYKYFGKHLEYYPQQYLFSHLTERNPSIDLCVHCGNCHAECPVGIDLPILFTQAKYLKHKRNWQLGDYLLANPELLAMASQINAPLSNWLMNQKSVRMAMELTIGVHRNRTLPALDNRTLPATENRRGMFLLMEKEARKAVIYYPGCFATYFETVIARAATKLLETSGFRVIMPTQNCCGLPLISLGDVYRATKKSEQIVSSLSQANYHEMDIVTTCPSCSLALKHDYIALGIKGAENVAKRVYDLEQFVLMLHDSGKTQLKLERLAENVAYHMPCHLRTKGADKLPVNFLRLVPGLLVHPINRGCCGMSGTFGQKKRYFDYSINTGKPLFEAIQNTPASFVCTECGPCKLQITQGTGKKTVHPAVLLAELLLTE